MKAFKKLSLMIFGAVLAFSLNIRANALTANLAAWAKCVLINANTVSYQASLTSLPASDDNMLYLYALMPYEYSVGAGDVLIASAPLSTNPAFTFSLNDRICNKFALCVKAGGVYTMIAEAQYITNPEVAATRTRTPQSVPFVEPYEKMALVQLGQVSSLNILTFNYSTIVVVNKSTPALINPKAKTGDPHPIGKKMYYALNAGNAEGVSALRTHMLDMAGNTHVDEFIIGNEVNTRTWNYMALTSWEDYIREYVQAFRVAYNTIKSTNANAKVYISLDQQWNRKKAGDYSFIDGADFLLIFNDLICREGNIDWCLAFHPYLTPMTYAKFWDMSGCPNGAYYQQQIQSNAVVSFQNLPAMTGFMAMPAMKNTKGAVRDIILPEIGITQAQGVEVQAAAMLACYQACRNNPYIKRIFFHRINEGGATNFSTTGISEQVYQAIAAGNPGAYNQWGLNYLGISDWRQIVMY